MGRYRRGDVYIGTNGVYLGSTSSQTMNMTVKAAGIVIPVTQTATFGGRSSVAELT